MHSQHWSDEKWKSIVAKRGGNRKRFQYCTDLSGDILYLRAFSSRSFRTQFLWSFVTGQCIDSGTVSSSTFYHVGCAINLHSITNSGLIAGGQNSSRVRQTVFFTAVNPMHKNHKDPKELDLDQATFCIVQAITRCVGSIYRLFNGEIEVLSNKIERNYPPRYALSSLYLEKQSRWILKKSHTREYMCHFEYHRQFPSKIVGCPIWILKYPIKYRETRMWREREEIEESTKFDRDTLNQDKHDDVTNPTSTGSPVCGKTLLVDT